MESEYVERFTSLFEGGDLLRNFEFKRRLCYFPRDEIDRVEIHLFSDGSKKAISANAYAVFHAKDGKACSSLLMTRDKMAPLEKRKKVKNAKGEIVERITKEMTIPRLELMGCLLGSQLALYAYNSLEDLLPSQTLIYFHTDSEISAYWITDSDIFSLKQFVNRRTKMIRQNMNELKDKVSEQRMVEIELRHIPGHENPADITSRGSTFKTFFDPKNLQSYLHGPPWLTQSKEHWPSQPETFDPRLSHHFEDFKRESLEVKKDEGSCELLGVVNNMDIGINRNEGLLKFLDQIFARHGFLKSIRILTYIFRFLKRTLGQTKTSSVFLFKRNQSTTVIPGASEVNEVRTDIIKLIQSSNYDHMVRKDGTGRLVVSKKVQRELGGGILFRDSNNILWLKGRLPDSRNAHQILLPGKSEFF